MLVLAVLEELESHERVTLRSRHVVGRGSIAHLQLQDRRVSNEHAVFSWSGSAWVLRDLQSRNGTWMDGEQLQPGLPMPVRVGSVLSFGALGLRWRVVSTDPPVAMAIPVSGGAPVIATFGMLALPDSESVEVSVYRNGEGGWISERGDEVRPAADQEVLVLSEGAWTLDLPLLSDVTVDSSQSIPPRLDEVGLAFAVSRDQEYVEVEVLYNNQRLPLRPRADLELLLQLARLRIQDQEGSEVPESERGWVYRDELLKMLAISENTLHQRVFRAREQLARVGIDSAAGVVERRLPTGQIRIGVSHLTVRDL